MDLWISVVPPNPGISPPEEAGTSTSRRCVVLLSGGLDSATVLAVARQRGFELYALSFRYGQRHEQELEAAKRVAARGGVARHEIVDIDLRAFGGSALTADIPVPKDRDEEEMGIEIPVTYVPARNTIFLSLALGWAEVVGADDIFIGVNAVDYSGYPDCRPEFIAAFERLANVATRASTQEGRRLTVHAPLLDLTKADIIRLGISLGVDFGITTSCYDPDDGGGACGRCDACRLRLGGFAAAGLEDPAPYTRGVARVR
jgi:7-cyano-7-deazaguanine synthase